VPSPPGHKTEKNLPLFVKNQLFYTIFTLHLDRGFKIQMWNSTYSHGLKGPLERAGLFFHFLLPFQKKVTKKRKENIYRTFSQATP
jgi:hypothetical protein